MFCRKCGEQNNDEVKFCRNCGENIFIGKKCPFCKLEISKTCNICPGCKQVLIEKISSDIKRGETKKEADHVNHTGPNFILKFVNLIKGIDYRKYLFNRYSIIVFVVILIVLFSDSSSTYNSKLPLPVPIPQTVDQNKPNITIPAVSLANGTILKKGPVYFRGDGELEIKNGTSLDAVAKLIRNGTSVLTVYIKANSNYTITNITDGLYWLAFTQGLDWNSTTGKFQRNIQYSSFDDTFDFITTDTKYTIFEITLNPVVGGTAETSSVDPSQFNAY